MNEYTNQSNELLKEPVEQTIAVPSTSDGAEVSRIEEGHKDVICLQEAGPDEEIVFI